MSDVTPGWALELRGDQVDLEDLRGMLIRPFNPWVEDYATGGEVKLLLRSNCWESLTEAGEVMEDARRIISLLNGQARLIHNDARPILPGELLRFASNGTKLKVLVAGTANFKLEGVRMRATARTLSASPPSPQESKMQLWLREAEADEVRADLFMHVSRMDNWFDLYKSMELAQRVAKGKDRVEGSLGKNDWEEWKRIWPTANCHRHAPDPVKFPLPPDPPDLATAISFVLTAVRRLV